MVGDLQLHEVADAMIEAQMQANRDGEGLENPCQVLIAG